MGGFAPDLNSWVSRGKRPSGPPNSDLRKTYQCVGWLPRALLEQPRPSRDQTCDCRAPGWAEFGRKAGGRPKNIGECDVVVVRDRGAIDVTKPLKTWFGNTHGAKPYEFIGCGARVISHTPVWSQNCPGHRPGQIWTESWSVHAKKNKNRPRKLEGPLTCPELICPDTCGALSLR